MTFVFGGGKAPGRGGGIKIFGKKKKEKKFNFWPLQF